MIIYELKLNNFYKFKNFEMDLTVPRSSVKSPILQQHKKYPNIKYKKFALLLGANASGKTTLGRALCVIQNFLVGKNMYMSWIIDLIKGLENQDKPLEWEIIFSHKSKLYYNRSKLKSTGIVYEEWRHINLKNQYYPTLRNELMESSNHYIEDDFLEGLYESFFIMDDTTPINDLNFGYTYSFSGDDANIDLNQVDAEHLTKILYSFDTSIEKVTNSEEVKGNKIVTFKDGHKEIILPSGKLVKGSKAILSTGTKESIILSYILAMMSNNTRETLYVDEKMSHVHSEIEQQIIQIMITLIDKLDGQVFITSHNADLLNMKIPNYNYLLFKKNNDGSINELIQPEKVIKHNDRTLKSIVEQDIFSTAPNLDKLIDLHDLLAEDIDE